MATSHTVCMLNTRLGKWLLTAGTWCAAGTLLAQPGQLPPANRAGQPQRRITAVWQGQELGVVLKRIAASAKIPIWLDRQVDPQQVVNAQFDGAALAEVFDQLTADSVLGWSSWEGVVYVGPRGTAEVLATLLANARDKVSRLPKEIRRRWLQTAPPSWPRLSDPRDILSDWLSAAGIELSGREMLSHDLWDARELPPLPLVDRVVLLLAGFDMTCAISANGKTCRVVRLEQPVLMIREYSAGSRAGQLVEAFKNESRVTVTRRGSKVQLAGRWEDHQRAEEILRSETTERRTREPSARRGVRSAFSLRLENQPVGKVIDQLGRQLELEVVWRAEPDDRNTLVSGDVSDGTLEELLTAVLTPAGLEFRLDEKRLEILSGE